MRHEESDESEDSDHKPRTQTFISVKDEIW